MKIPDEGLSKEEIFKLLDQISSDDVDWSSGRVFGYVFDPGRDILRVAEQALVRFYHKSGLDFTVYPSLLRMENDIVDFAITHLNGDENSAGSFTSGGTESIILAVKAARDYMRDKKKIRDPEMIVPETAHAAFHKAAHYLGVKLVQIPVNPETMKADPRALKDAITRNTILIVGSAPCYSHGVIDPIEEMSEIARKRGILFHTDACMGGFILPFMRELGYDVPPFDFSLPGVTSISMDLHKYAYSPKGASVVLYRTKELRKYQYFACSKWTGYTMINTTVQSTKSGGPLAAAWATLNYVGKNMYLEFIRKKLKAVEKIVKFVENHPDLYLVTKPEMTLIAFSSETVNIFHIIDEVNSMGWYVQPALRFGNSGEHIHLSVNYSNVDRIDAFLEDLKVAVENARKLPSGTLLKKVKPVLSIIKKFGLSGSTVYKLMKLSGIEKGKLPERFAPINEVLNELPPELREELLIEFTNNIFR